ncbi:MAG: PAS domain S-box protein [Chloroflexi bacterium]|nr:PAS domain S-box protein [Chloroflexota bacterium]
MGIINFLFSIRRTFEAERAKYFAVEQGARQAAEQRSQELAAQVAESESRYRQVFENANDAIFIHDLQGRFIEVNQFACQQLGYARAELLQMAVKEIDTPQAGAHFEEGVQALVQQGQVVVTSCHVRKDGTPIPVEISARIIEYNGQPAVLSVARDISERKRAEAEIQARNQELDALYRQAEERARRIAVSNEIIRTVSSARTLEQIFQTFAEQTRKLVPYDRMSIALVHEASTQLTVHSIAETGMSGPQPGMLVQMEGTATPMVSETRQPFICSDVSQEPRFPVAKQMLEKLGIQSYVILPLFAKDEFLGALNLGSRSTNAYHETDLHVLVPIAGQLAIVIENARLQEQIASMAIREERDRLGRELHDSLGQVLGYIGLKTDQINSWLRRGLIEDARQGLTELNQVAQTAYADVRESILGLRATVTTNAGLEHVLREYLNRYQREWRIAGDLAVAEGALPRLLPSVEIQLLRIVQEALTNARKHAQASHVWIRFEREGERLVVTIRDDGIGFDPTLSRREHFGLETMRERAESVRGTWQVDSAPGRGAVIRVTLPASS